ncbi:hypothetical protein P3T76_010777 [Phytophthora citrophthora]|uniref:Uncharacterized protein n=1 Tax=Phytophthora citrophthora TaxID=4793 RepID=A0AAD9GAY3_9STRA|nr:hypothetical protein P3T76_010777 [Phytophthora citrophthora]
MEPTHDETPLNDSGEEEEEVEIFSADATSSSHSQAPSSDRVSVLPPAPRRCVSKEMLEQMPTLNINVCCFKK